MTLRSLICLKSHVASSRHVHESRILVMRWHFNVSGLSTALCGIVGQLQPHQLRCRACSCFGETITLPHAYPACANLLVLNFTASMLMNGIARASAASQPRCFQKRKHLKTKAPTTTTTNFAFIQTWIRCRVDFAQNPMFQSFGEM